MPPVTRRALRSNTSLVDNNNNPATNDEPLISETPTNSARPVLGEVAGNCSDASTAANDLTEQERPTKKSTAKGKGAINGGRGNSAARKDNSKTETTHQGTGNTAVVSSEEENEPLPDEEAMGDSEAGGGSPEEMLGEEHQKGTDGILPKPDIGGTLDVESPAGQSTEDRLSPSQYKTPKFDPNVHISPVTDMAGDAEDSFLESIVKRSPPRLIDDGDLLDAPEYSVSPVSLSRQSSRIEDSVEAIDALEDALEEIGEALPNVDNGFNSPVRGPSPTDPEDNVEVGKRTSRTNGAKRSVSSVGNKRVEPKGRATKPGPPTTRRSAASKPPPTNRNPYRSTSRSQTAGLPDRTASPRKPENTPAPGSTLTKKGGNPTSTAATKEVKTPISKRQKPHIDPSNLSTSKPGFVPVKSTKAPTRPAFELPGEAISRRKREQREEKTRQEEEERQRRRAFKAKPARISSVPSVAVKETATSRIRARASLIEDDFAKDGAGPSPTASSKRNSTIVTPTRSPSFQSVGSAASKRNSLLGVSKKSSLTSLATRASSVSRGPAVGSPTVGVSNAGSESDQNAGAVTPTRKGSNVTPADTVHQRARGKEIFQRDQLQREERSRERREKEEAAKKARVEAAERGRLASREWAERQRLRKASGK